MHKLSIEMYYIILASQFYHGRKRKNAKNQTIQTIFWKLLSLSNTRSKHRACITRWNKSMKLRRGKFESRAAVWWKDEEELAASCRVINLAKSGKLDIRDNSGEQDRRDKTRVNHIKAGSERLSLWNLSARLSIPSIRPSPYARSVSCKSISTGWLSSSASIPSGRWIRNSAR